jgi:hypothetical protein
MAIIIRVNPKGFIMPFKLVHNKNYAYLFLVIFVLTLSSILLTKGKLTGLVFVLSFFHLGISQLISGVALDRSWTARYKKKEDPFIFWTVVVLCFVIGTFVLIRIFLSFF